MLSMCLLFCFVVFWILCCVVCEKKKKKLLLQSEFRRNHEVYSTESLMGRSDGGENEMQSMLLCFAHKTFLFHQKKKKKPSDLLANLYVPLRNFCDYNSMS